MLAFHSPGSSLVHAEIQYSIGAKREFRSIFQARRFAAELPAIEPAAIRRAQIAHVQAVGPGEDFQVLARDAGIINGHLRRIEIMRGIYATASNNDAWSIDFVA